MRKILKLLLLTIGILATTAFIYERYFLTKWYDFQLNNIQLEVMSDECDMCFLDYPIDHTIWVTTDDQSKGKFELYTEVPRLEFGLNKNSSQLLINCLGFTILLIDLTTMEKITMSFEQKNEKLNEFTIQWIVNSNKELMKFKSLSLPDRNWEEK